MPSYKGQQWAIIQNGATIALKYAHTAEQAAAKYPGCNAVLWANQDHPKALCFCRHCGGGNTYRYDRQHRYCKDCRVAWSLSYWRDRPGIQQPDPTLSRDQQIAELVTQGVSQRQIGKMLEISQGRVSQLISSHSLTIIE